MTSYRPLCRILSAASDTLSISFLNLLKTRSGSFYVGSVNTNRIRGRKLAILWTEIRNYTATLSTTRRRYTDEMAKRRPK